MPEDVSNHFAFPKFTNPVSETLRKILDNNNKIREKTPFKGLSLTKGVAMMLEKGMKVAKEYYVFNYGPP